MEIVEASNLVYEYLDINISDDMKILGEDHPYNDSTIGKVNEAFNLLTSSGFFDEQEEPEHDETRRIMMEDFD